jgi:hypothetical protein
MTPAAYGEIESYTMRAYRNTSVAEVDSVV